ncbi:MAG: HlyD family efflux transporter periplasmic adaptor subunit [Saprospirales bacterium]|nr:MAG: HlyD family efflux transporter periplasmic adaptor subunit [Saprospirales bacterium]
MDSLVKNLLGVLAAGLVIWLIYSLAFDRTGSMSGEGDVKVRVEHSDLEIQVRATGELQARNSVKITGPSGMRTAGIFRTTISDLIPEGTVVEEGDYVATLDRSEVTHQIQATEAELERINNQLVQLRIDTALEMQSLRDQLINQRSVLEEREIQLAQSKYEPQMTIRQAEIDFQRAERTYNQQKSNYLLKQEQAAARIAEVRSTHRQEQMKLDNLNELAEEFTVRSPAPGMVIYQRSWGGRKGPGSEITPWDPTVAELPDLSEFISRTFVNEIDISKVSVGQDVQITVDAFPENTYTGRVTEVANIGQQLRNQDARVFEVTILLNDSDSLLRPAMTTGNRILVDRFEEVLHLPLEAVHRDTVPYVIAEVDGRPIRQEVVMGAANNIRFTVAAGVQEDQNVYLAYSGDKSELPFVELERETKEKALQDIREDRAAREEKRRQRSREFRDETPAPRRSSNGGSVIIIN